MVAWPGWLYMEWLSTGIEILSFSLKPFQFLITQNYSYVHIAQSDDTALILSDANLTTLEMKDKSERQKIVHSLNENELTLNYSKTTYV